MRQYAYITPKHFEYFQPTTLPDALKLLAEHGPNGARILAGGQSLLISMRRRAQMPGTLIDIKRVAALSTIKTTARGLELGAATLLDDVSTDETVVESLPRLAEVVKQMGAVQILNRATVGGSVCDADPASDLVPILASLGAVAIVESVRGRTEIAIEAIARGPHESHLAEDELLVAVVVPAQPRNSRSGFANFRRRGGDYPVAQAAVRLTLDTSDRVSEVSIFVGGAGPTAIRSSRAEESLKGQGVNDETARAAGRLAESEANPIVDVRGGSEWRSAVVGAVVTRALLSAVA